MDAEKIIKLSRHHKKSVIAFLAMLYLISLLITHYYFGQGMKDVLLDQFKYIASSLITALFGLLVIVTFIPKNEKGEILEIPAQEITEKFEELLASATRWRYQGNFGRYLRGKVLPSLAYKANVQVLVCIIDPENKKLCEQHAEYRGKINAIDKGKRYDAAEVSLQVVVTIVIASWYARNRGMDISIFLSGKFEPIRIDSNDAAMILTVEDRRSPALMITQKHFTANHFNLQMQTARDQSRKIELGGMRNGIQLAEIEIRDVENVLGKAGLAEICQEITPQVILNACNASKNPYEN